MQEIIDTRQKMLDKNKALVLRTDIPAFAVTLVGAARKVACSLEHNGIVEISLTVNIKAALRADHDGEVKGALFKVLVEKGFSKRKMSLNKEGTSITIDLRTTDEINVEKRSRADSNLI